MKRILFVRDYKGFSGGHLKVFHYFTHAVACDLVEPKVYFSPSSRWDSTNPWFGLEASISKTLGDVDAFFIAGCDWDILDEARIDLVGKPVFNLVQGVRHANPSDARFRFLSRDAVRICTSSEIAACIQQTGQVRGRVIVIEAGLDLDDLERFKDIKKSEIVFIGGLKNPTLARQVASELTRQGLEVELQTQAMPRDAFLSKLAAASIVVLLPLRQEGFFLPALEAMAVGSALIVPDCVGNRSFCLPEMTCLMPDYNSQAIQQAVLRLAAEASLREALVKSARERAIAYSLTIERRRFHGVLTEYFGADGKA